MENPVSRRCLFVGTVTRDILMELEEPPASDRRLAARRVTSASGGPAATAAAAFADLGGRGGLIAPVGRDENGETVGRDLSALGLEPLSLPVLDGPTAFSVILVEPGGKRCIVHYGGCVQGLAPDLLTPELLAGADVVHLAGMTGPQAVALARRCREVRPEAQLSVDGGNLDGPSLEALAGLSDILVPDDKTVQKSLGLDPEAACRRFRPTGRPAGRRHLRRPGLRGPLGRGAAPDCRLPRGGPGHHRRRRQLPRRAALRPLPRRRARGGPPPGQRLRGPHLHGPRRPRRQAGPPADRGPGPLRL